MSLHRPTPPALFDGALLRAALGDALFKLHPRALLRSPVMFVTAVVAALATVLTAREVGSPLFPVAAQIAGWLWVTVLFANFAEAVAEGRGKAQAAAPPRALTQAVERVAKAGGTPLVVVRDDRLLGVVHLKDIIKPGIRERFATLRRMGIRTVMVTGDNPLTAAAIAAEAGVDDFLAEATPERKLELIRACQKDGRLVAMCGDGSNDAPALAQADVGVAMNTGTQAAREAGNMVDLVTASASGLDPHVSPAAALWQVERVARARGVPVPEMRAFVLAHVEGRELGILGEPRVNLLALDMALDARWPRK